MYIQSLRLSSVAAKPTAATSSGTKNRSGAPAKKLTHIETHYPLSLRERVGVRGLHKHSLQSIPLTLALSQRERGLILLNAAVNS
jgi:hypothetical protein